jgi:Uma2 family endonuclease
MVMTSPFGPAKTHATYADVLAAPEGVTAELIEGNLYLQPRPRGVHRHVIGELRELLRPARSSSGWVILPEVELHIPMTLVPDLSGWRAERFTEPLDSTHFCVVPDWVCEVLSPSTAGYDRGIKRRVYLDRGVQFLWIVDPAERTLEAYEAYEDASAWTLRATYTADDKARLAPFSELEINLEQLWALA